MISTDTENSNRQQNSPSSQASKSSTRRMADTEENEPRRASIQLQSNFFFPSPLGQPVLVEYQNRGSEESRIGIIHINPGETVSVIRRKIQDNPRLMLYETHEVFTGFEGPNGLTGNRGFYVVWCGGDYDHETKISGQQEFLAVCRMMERRGWRDRLKAIS